MRSRSLWPVAFLLAALGITAVIDATMAQMSTTGIGKSGAGGPPPTCNGVLDLSAGCMFPPAH